MNHGDDEPAIVLRHRNYGDLAVGPLVCSALTPPTLACQPPGAADVGGAPGDGVPLALHSEVDGRPLPTFRIALSPEGGQNWSVGGAMGFVLRYGDRQIVAPAGADEANGMRLVLRTLDRALHA